LDVTVSLQRRHHDVEEPEEDEEGGGGNFPISGSTQFTSDHFVTPQHHQAHGHDGCTAEQRHREGQASGWDVEDLAVIGFVDGGYRPSNADTQEDVNGITARYIADGSISVLVLNGSHFAGERVWNTGTQSHERNGGDRVFETDSAAQMRGQVTDDGRQDANHQNRNKETDVAVRNVCKQMVDLFLETKEASSAIIMSTPQFSTK